MPSEGKEMIKLSQHQAKKKDRDDLESGQRAAQQEEVPSIETETEIITGI